MLDVLDACCACACRAVVPILGLPLQPISLTFLRLIARTSGRDGITGATGIRHDAGAVEGDQRRRQWRATSTTAARSAFLQNGVLRGQRRTPGAPAMVIPRTRVCLTRPLVDQ